jgi:RNA polymerase sigma factor (sigma-70 family)
MSETNPIDAGNPSPGMVPEQELTLRAVAGDREAFIQLVEHHLDELYSFASREIRYHESLGDLEPGELAPEDVVSETTLTALQVLARKPRRSTFQGLLRHLVLAVIEHWALRSRERRRHERLRLEEGVPLEQDRGPDMERDIFMYYQPDDLLTWEDTIPDASLPPPEEIPAIEEEWEAMEILLNSLPADQRMVFGLHAIEGLSLEEIAAMQRQPLHAVKVLYEQGREALRARLTDRMVVRPAS